MTTSPPAHPKLPVAGDGSAPGIPVRSDGIVLALSEAAPDAPVAAVSHGSADLWGLRPAQLIGVPLDRIIRVPALADIRPTSHRVGPTRVRDILGTEWLVTVTCRDRQTLVHLENGTVSPGDGTPELTGWLADATERLEFIRDPAAMWPEVCDTLRHLLGVDRVMVVRSTDGVDEVVVECAGDTAVPLTGVTLRRQHVPLTQHDPRALTRALHVHDTDAPPAHLSPPTDETGRRWSLRDSPLAHPTPDALATARHLGARTLLTLFVPEIAGIRYTVIAAAHQLTPVDAVTRSAAELYTRVLTSRLREVFRSARTLALAERRELQHRIVERSASIGLAAALTSTTTGDTDLLTYIASDAAIVSIGDQQHTAGDLDDDEIAAVTTTVRQWVQSLGRHESLTTDDVSQLHPELAARAPRVAGLLVAPIGTRGDFVCWVRHPTPRTVLWLDGVHPHSPDPLRVTLEQARRGSLHWGVRDRDAADSFVRELEDTLLTRAQAELAELALIDPLTGLPNRRLLLDRINGAIERARRGHRAALLFLDLNGFKTINDTHGHRVGDAVLVEAARRLTALVRTADTVARLAGDEFVVLTEGIHAGDERMLADRIRAAFAAPVTIDGVTLPLSIAVGVGMLDPDLLDPTLDAAQLLDRADRAMYAEKTAMRMLDTGTAPGTRNPQQQAV